MTLKPLPTLSAALLAGAAIIAVLIVLSPDPERSDSGPTPRAVRTMEVTPLRFNVTASGYGSVRAEESWRASARVGGRVIKRHPDLESGNVIAEGTELLQIDPTQYELVLTSARADIAVIRSEQSQLEQRAANLRQLLALEEERLNLAEGELERARNLAERDALSQARLDEQQRNTLRQRQAVQSLENELALIPTRRETLEAQLARAGSARDQASRNLADTRFIAPFDLRVHEVQTEVHEEVQPGQSLFVADSIRRAEAIVQIPVPQLRRLLAQLPGGSALEDSDLDAGLHRRFNLGSIRSRLILAGAPQTSWPAQFTRIASGLDPQTRTAAVVLTVEEPYRNANPPEQPPLVRAMFVQAELQVLTQHEVLVVPVSAVHADHVYLVDQNNRLERRAVTVAWTQRDLAIIQEGLESGEQLILDDLEPAIEGTPLTPVRDEHAMESTTGQARGQQP